MSSDACRIGVLVSGGGTNLQSIIDHIHLGESKASITCVISNVPSAYALTRAANAHIPQYVIEHTHYDSRTLFEEALIETLQKHHVDMVVLAGFMRVLKNTFISRYEGRILNIHPSLLPKYPGLNTHRRAIENGDSSHGCSVHIATAELDGGPLILQASVPVLEDDTEESLAKRVLEKEHLIYPICVQWLCENKIHYANGHAYFEGKKLTTPLQLQNIMSD